jgi:hypothetical protein
MPRYLNSGIQKYEEGDARNLISSFKKHDKVNICGMTAINVYYINKSKSIVITELSAPRLQITDFRHFYAYKNVPIKHINLINKHSLLHQPNAQN